MVVVERLWLSYEYYINKGIGIGQWYPKDLSEKVERALEFIL